MSCDSLSIVRGAWRLLLACCLGMLCQPAFAAEVTVRASLERGVTVIGDPVQLQIKITGARRVDEPPEFQVDGLTFSGPSSSTNSTLQLRNGAFTSERTQTFVYEVVAEKSGAFEIPAASVSADGRTYQTQPVALKVQPSATAESSDEAAMGFAEIEIAKKALFVGETAPMQLRLYVRAEVRSQRPERFPDVKGDGFTMQKASKMRVEQAQRNGREYTVMIFETAITSSRAGQLVLGPVDFSYVAQVPRARRRNAPRSLFDAFGDDIFGDPLYAVLRQMKATAPAVELTVKPLPVAGRPPDFSGAVGTFQMAVEGSPQQVKMGDPVTMRARVSGRGNFDRMSAPVLKDSAGWRAYPPSNAFQAGDEVGFAGTKTFEIAVVPETKKTQMPVLQFSYFDPGAERYVTLDSEPVPLLVEGSARPALSASPETAASARAAPAPASDLLGLRYDRGSTRSFRALHERREFWWAQGALGAALAIFLAARMRRQPSAAAREAEGLRRERAVCRRRLRSAALEADAFLETAVRLAQIEIALRTGRSPASIDLPAIRAAGRLSADNEKTIEEIFSARAERLYAGVGAAGMSVERVPRERIFSALDELGGRDGQD